MTAHRTDERGFTLVELLTAMLVGMIVIFAVFGLVDTATSRQHKAIDRIEANDRGRVAMDLISQQLTSRVCVGTLPSGTLQGSLVSATASQIEFFTSLSLTPESSTVSQRLVLERRRLTYRPAPNNDVREETWVGSAPAPALPPATSTTPTKTRTLIQNVALVGTTNFFRYYAMPALPAVQEPTVELTPVTNVTKVARIDVSFAAKGKVAGITSPLKNQILDRSPGCYFGS